MSQIKYIKFVCILLLIALTGCATPRVLAPASGLYTSANPYPEATIPENYRQSKANLIFVTDRGWDDEKAEFITIRSRAVTAGSAVVRIGEETSWNDLMIIARNSKESRERPILLLEEIQKEILFPATPIPYRLENGIVIEQADIVQDYAAARESFKELIRDRIERQNTSKVLIYIHGFNTGFDDAAFDLTDVWHSSGRNAVPIFFSWPTEEGNLFGYFSAKESGEFSIFHLKEMLRTLHSMPEIETINIVTHSRGVDVTTTALRELIIEARGSGVSPMDALKIENLIIAAADIDGAVAGQRLLAERFAPAIGQITIYSNPGDLALRLSSFIGNGLRVGRVTNQTYLDAVGNDFAGIENVSFIDVSGLSGSIGHSYFREHPSVIADISIILQSGAGPDDPRRNLTLKSGNFYIMAER